MAPMMPEEKIERARRLRTAMEQANLTQTEMAEALRERSILATQTTVSRWLRDKDPQSPRDELHVIEAWANITRTSSDWLLYGDGPMRRLPDDGDGLRLPPGLAELRDNMRRRTRANISDDDLRFLLSADWHLLSSDWERLSADGWEQLLGDLRKTLHDRLWYE